MSSSIDRAVDNFLEKAKNKKKIEQIKKNNEQKIIEEKNVKLRPIKKLLKKFVDMNIMVFPKESYARNFNRSSIETFSPVLFEVYQDPSSGTWSPGVSVFFDNPAEVEIAIPNDDQIEDMGEIIIRCASNHPAADILNKRVFRSVEDACMALSNFLSESIADYNFKVDDK